MKASESPGTPHRPHTIEKDPPIPLSGAVRRGERGAGLLHALLESQPLADLAAALLLGAGIAMAVVPFTILDNRILVCLACGLPALALIALLRLRWWIAPSMAALVLAGNAVVRTFTGSLREWASYWLGYLRWMLAGTPYDAVYSEGASLVLLQALLVSALVLLLYPLAKRPALFPLTLALTGGAAVLLFLIQPGDASSVICLLAAGLIVLLPGFYAGRAGMDRSDKASRARMQVIAIPVAVLAVGLSGAIVPEDTAPWRSRFLTNLVSDASTFFRGSRAVRPVSSTNFSLGDLGFQPGRERLGGPVTLDDSPGLTVTTPVPVLLRGAVFDGYDGSGWHNAGFDGEFRYQSLFFRGYRREAFDLDRPLGGREAARLYSGLTREITLEVRHDTSRYTTLFTAGRPASLRLDDALVDAEAYFNLRGEAYMHLRMPSRHGFTLTTKVWNTAEPDFREDFFRLEALAGRQEDERYGLLLERYTALPDAVGPEVRQLAAEITAEAGSPYAKILALLDWLGENCEYSLEVPAVPEGAEFVAHFLETREGYCTYYATALAVLARSLGIPARYVTGYALEEAEGKEPDTYRATGLTAHAWTELYLSGIGWMEVDPLAWNPREPLNVLPEAEEAESPAVPPAATPTEGPEREPEAPTTPYREDPLPEADSSRQLLRFLGVLLGVAAAALLLRLLVRFLEGRKDRAYRLRNVLRRQGSPDRCLDHYYRDILRQLALLDMKPGPADTLVTFPARVDKRIVFEDIALGDIARARMLLHFAGTAPAIGQVEQAELYHRRLEALLRQRLGRALYLLRRALAQ